MQRLARGRGGGSRNWERIRRTVLTRDMNVCGYCGAEGADTVDHIIPWSRGGQDTLDNLVAACRACNRAKSDRPAFWNPAGTSPTPLASLRPRGTTEHQSWA